MDTTPYVLRRSCFVFQRACRTERNVRFGTRHCYIARLVGGFEHNLSVFTFQVAGIAQAAERDVRSFYLHVHRS